jgi:selenocysteine-specific elongation factor
MGRIIVGTAGHIDHGKSTLVRALTGTDPDRLPEEKKRGITLDLGYAFLGDIAAIIDVPGHEKLIRNMVAGAATVDFALLVVAADDGVMPQTLEHLQILRLLGILRGCIVLTKCGAVDPEWISLVEEQVRSAVAGSFLEGAPVFRVDSLSGVGVPEFRDALIALLSAIPARSERGVFRLPIDRVFSIKGRGTVVTGTVLSGTIQKDARLAVLPGGFDVRVKRLETHSQEENALLAGQRAALNLVGDTERLERGQTLAYPESLLVSSRVKVRIDLLPDVEPLKDRQRLRFLIGTQETIGRVQLTGKPEGRRYYANLLLESDAVIIWGDHYVLRQYSPLKTLGGGRVLEPVTPRLRVKEMTDETCFSEELDTEDLPGAILAFLNRRGQFGYEIKILAAVFGVTPESLVSNFARKYSRNDLIISGDYLILTRNFETLCSELNARLKALHEKSPQSKGFSRSDLQSGSFAALPDILFDQVVRTQLDSGALVSDGALFRKPEHAVVRSPQQKALQDRIQDLLKKAQFAPPVASVISETLERPRPEIEKALVMMDKLGICRRLGLDLFFEASEFETAEKVLIGYLREKDELTVSDAARLLSSSRKYVVPFLEYLDSRGITERQGNVRKRGRNYPSD